MIKIDFDKFESDFKLKKNKFDKDAAFDGYMFETYGEELNFIEKENQKNPQKIWTVLDVDGDLIVVNGYHVVDRFGYFISKKSFEVGQEYEIVD